MLSLLTPVILRANSTWLVEQVVSTFPTAPYVLSCHFLSMGPLRLKENMNLFMIDLLQIENKVRVYYVPLLVW